MKTLLALAFALAAGAAYAGPPLNCPGNSCNAPPFNNGPDPVAPAPTSPVDVTIRGNAVGVSRQVNTAPVTSIVSGVTVRATAGTRGSARVLGNTISATAVGNSSVIRVVRGQ